MFSVHKGLFEKSIFVDHLSSESIIFKSLICEQNYKEMLILNEWTI